MPQKFFPYILLLFVTLVLSAAVARAEDDEPKRGVLPDGRAFRTDGEGSQIVDYIAELEVNVETLEKRVYGLEDEVKEKQAAIDRLQRGGNGAVKVSERELLQPERIECPSCPPPQPRMACPEVPPAVSCPPAPRCDDRSAEVAALRSLMSDSKTEAGQVRAQIAQLRAQLEKERNARSEEVANYEEALQKIEGPAKSSAQQVAALSKRLEQTRSQAQSESDLRMKQERDFQVTLRAKQQEIEAKESQLEARSEEIGRLQARVTELRAEQSKAQLRAERAEATASNSVGMASYRASAAQQAPVSRSALSGSAVTLSPAPSSSLLSARERAMEGLRSEVSAGLARLNTAAHTRDSLFSRWDQRGRAIQIKPSPLRTSRGSTPDSISRQLASASSVRDMIILRDEVRYLEGRVNDDIAVVRRMSPKH